MDVNCATTRRKSQQHVKLCPKEEKNASLKKVSIILQKSEDERTLEDQQILAEYSEVVEDLKMRWHRRDEAKRRLEEIEEPMDVIEGKCRLLVEAIVKSEHLVVYTGAGISTAACIPDYRGSNGIWTRLQQGKDIGNHDLSLAEPTATHMALAELYHKKILKYVVSQNCDGLHLRSGLPRTALSELHGNMYIEVCKTCKPVREYWRKFDVTENTARYAHKTMRRCYACNGELVDTIVHFGERGTLQWPLNWPGACKNAGAADTIICLGSSLKVLKKYPLLWQMSKPAKKRPNLYIINLQWTPKDDCASLKINGKCDDVMRILMKYLGLEIPPYNRKTDPIFSHASDINAPEAHTTNQPCLKAPALNTPPCSPRTARNNFTIDGILSGATAPNPSALMAAYYLNLQNFFLPNLTNLYPFQTSLLYSGLHSIINPLPVLNYDFKNESAAIAAVDYAAGYASANCAGSGAVGANACEYCLRHYKTFYCQFYAKYEPVFEKTLLRFSKREQIDKELICVCCDYTTDEDGDEEECAESDGEVKKIKIDPGAEISKAPGDTTKAPENTTAPDDTKAPEKIIKNSVNATKAPENPTKAPALNAPIAPAVIAPEPETKIKIQAGWFGKGYKKNRKAPRKKPPR